MKRKIKEIMTIALATMLFTPIFTAPKLPTIPKFSITIPTAVTESAKKAGQEAVKKIDWSNFDFSMIFKRNE